MSILYYLSKGTELQPNDGTKMLQWLSFEQSEIQSSIGAARYIAKFCGDIPPDELISDAHRALAVVETQLKESSYILTSGYSICDIALYGYIHLAAEALISLDKYPHILGWLARIVERANTYICRSSH
jgi:glutathione S-transferase